MHRKYCSCLGKCCRPHQGQHRIGAVYHNIIHGNQDTYVRFEAQEYTRQQLENLGCSVMTEVIEGGLHAISEEAQQAAVAFIKQKEKIRKTA